MRGRALLAERWSALRYGALLPAAGRARGLAGAYARLAAAAERVLHPERTVVAATRIARWLDVSAQDARRVAHASRISEAIEEADAMFFMRHERLLWAAFRDADQSCEGAGPLILASLHFGSPLLQYLYLCRARGGAVGAILRPLDRANRMVPAKLRWGTMKTAWAERVTGRPFLHTDSVSMVRARALLRGGHSVYLLVDVPGDAVARRAGVALFGERVSIAAGLVTLARIAHSAVQPVVTSRQGGTLVVRYGRRIAPGSGVDVLERVMGELSPFIAERPGEWWMWPFLHGDGSAA